MITNKRLVDASGPDFYPTPRWGTLALLQNENFTGTILEPCCGTGDMSKVLKETNCKVISSDINDWGYGDVVDFFDINAPYDNIITNPPYNIANDILTHAIQLATQKVCILVRASFLESITRYNTVYSVIPPSRVYLFSERLSLYPAGSQVKGGGTTTYVWIVWDKNFTGEHPELHWIKPGLKKNSRQQLR